MSLKLGEIAPDFKAQTTDGEISFHDYIGDSYCMLFSHPKDFTPVCSTELSRTAALKPEFDKRNTKIIGLSVDSVGDHSKWESDIGDVAEHFNGAPLNFPLIADNDKKISISKDDYIPNDPASHLGPIFHRNVFIKNIINFVFNNI